MLKQFCAIIGLGAVAVINAQAATVTLVGDSINYQYDDAQAAMALFGAPTIVGDDIRFAPGSFRAESADGVGGAGGAGTVVTTANFIFDRVYSQSGAEIVGLQVIEFGDYRIDQGGSVDVDLLLTASSNISAFDYNSASGNFTASGDSSGLQTWGVDAELMPALAFAGPANDLLVSIQNTLVAETTADGELAWVQKKLSFVAVSEVPVPAAAWLFGSAILGLGALKRRSK